MPGKNAFDVAVEDWRDYIVSKGRDGCGGAAADTRQRRASINVRQEAPAVLRHYLLRSTIQVAGAAVVAEPCYSASTSSSLAAASDNTSGKR